MSNCLFGKCWIIHVAGVVCFVGDRAYDQKWNVIQVSHLCHRSPFHLSTVTFKSIDQILLFFAVGDELSPLTTFPTWQIMSEFAFHRPLLPV